MFILMPLIPWTTAQTTAQAPFQEKFDVTKKTFVHELLLGNRSGTGNFRPPFDAACPFSRENLEVADQ